MFAAIISKHTQAFGDAKMGELIALAAQQKAQKMLSIVIYEQLTKNIEKE